jgi:hypothetical protein
MSGMGKVMVAMGVILVVTGLAVWGLGRAGFRGLPGDVSFKSGNVRVYFPIVTCILISVLLTLALWAWGWIIRR